MATLTEIARATGLSPSTISRVLRDHRDVSDSTRQLVRRELQSHGFTPNLRPSRRGRPSKESKKTTLAVVCRRHLEARKDPFTAPIVSAALDFCAALGVQTLAVDWPAETKAMPPELQDADGVLFIGGSKQVQLTAAQKPAVTVDFYIPGSGADGVVADYRRGAFECAAYLLRKGHTRIALFSAARGPDEGFSNEIHDGALRALQLADLQPWEHFLAGSVTTPEAGYALAQKLLRLPEHERPTAIFGSDYAMLGALRAAHDLGFQVPAQLAIAGVDDIELGRYAVPRLSTVRVDKVQMARCAVERLLWRLAHRDATACRLVIDCRFVQRDSC